MQVNEIIQQANIFKKKYQEKRKQLQQLQDDPSGFKSEIKQKFHEQSVVKKLATAGKLDEKLSQTETDRAIQSVIKELEESAQFLSECKAQLYETNITLMKCNDKVEQHSHALEHEHDIRLHYAADKMASAIKWGIVAMVGGVGTATLAPLAGKII